MSDFSRETSQGTFIEYSYWDNTLKINDKVILKRKQVKKGLYGTEYHNLIWKTLLKPILVKLNLNNEESVHELLDEVQSFLEDFSSELY